MPQATSVGVTSRYAKGLVAPHEVRNVEAMECLSIEDALYTEWDYDAHLTTYFVQGETRWPRLKKACYNWLQEKAPIKSDLLVIDIDNDEHKSWTELGAVRKQAAIDQILEHDSGVLALWRWFYFTKNGMRVIYQLQSPVDVLECEDMHRGLLQEWHRAGIPGLDESTSDWTRLFRLPMVTREGEKTWEQDYFTGILDNEARCPNGLLPRISKGSSRATSQAIALTESERPEVEECFKIKWQLTDKGQVMTSWQKEARKQLKNRECFPYLFEGQTLKEGERHNTLLRMTGQVCRLCSTLSLASAENIYALFIDVVNGLEPDEETADWYEVCWNMVREFWGVELGKRQALEEEKIQDREKALSLGEMILKGIRRWYNKPAVHSNDTVAALASTQRIMLANHNSTFYLMGADGYYNATPLQSSQIIPRIRAVGMDGVIPTMTEDGKDFTATQMINRFSVPVTSVVAGVGGRGSWIEERPHDNTLLHLSLFRRNPSIRPKYSPIVDEWLHAFFNKHYDRGIEWLSQALAFDEGPICALSIRGGAGAGKKLLAQGLAECLEIPALATAEDLIGEYQYGLMSSPFLVVDEGWPKSNRFKVHPADAFRRLVGGDGVSCKRKFEAPVTVKSPVRILFTANNDNVVLQLSKDMDLSPEDRDAIAVRLLHMDIGDEGAKWLNAQGGRALTAKEGARWISPDSGVAPSDYVLARHLMHLYENRERVEGPRFLVSGDMKSRIIDEMRAMGSNAGLVTETIISMLKSYRPGDPNMSSGMHLIWFDTVGGILYLTSQGVREHYLARLQKKYQTTLTTFAIDSALKALSTNFVTDPYRPSPHLRRAKWHVIDIQALGQAAEHASLETSSIDKLQKLRDVT